MLHRGPPHFYVVLDFRDDDMRSNAHAYVCWGLTFEETGGYGGGTDAWMVDDAKLESVPKLGEAGFWMGEEPEREWWDREIQPLLTEEKKVELALQLLGRLT